MGVDGRGSGKTESERLGRLYELEASGYDRGPGPGPGGSEGTKMQEKMIDNSHSFVFYGRKKQSKTYEKSLLLLHFCQLFW